MCVPALYLQVARQNAAGSLLVLIEQLVWVPAKRDVMNQVHELHQGYPGIPSASGRTVVSQLGEIHAAHAHHII
jgi:hypothetical protein